MKSSIGLCAVWDSAQPRRGACPVGLGTQRVSENGARRGRERLEVERVDERVTRGREIYVIGYTVA